MKNNSTQDIRLGATIRRLRRERQLSQQALANMLGISTPYLNLIENQLESHLFSYHSAKFFH